MYALLPVVLALSAPPMKVAAQLAHPALLAGQKSNTYLKVWLEGLPLEDARLRPPVNLSVVIDRSGSMGGDKMERAIEAAMMIVDRLSRDDMLSVVSYDDVVDVIVPHGYVRDRETAKRAIGTLYARGSTALFAGTSRGISEVRHFSGECGACVNRVILLSDGQANVGPSSPNELGRLGMSAGKEGISITTIGLGLGYNEDLMSQLALKSDGNHAFAENGSDLKRLFDAELGDITSVVAQQLNIRIDFGPRCKPIRAMNRDAEISDRWALLRLNQLYAKQEKYVIFEVEIDGDAAGSGREVAMIDVEYQDRGQKNKQHQKTTARADFVKAKAEVDAREDKAVMVAVTESVAVERNKLALQLRDEGKVSEAEKTLKQNVDYLKQQSKRLASPRLNELSVKEEKNAAEITDQNKWNQTRKQMRKDQYEINTQQSY